ncbi:MAG: SLBB domain-containing protein [Microcoleaceae cyanobacterium]
MTPGSVAQAQVLPPPNFNPIDPNLNAPSGNLPERRFPNNIPAPTFQGNRAPAEQPYTLGPGDRVLVTIFQIPQYSGESSVLVNGTLSLAQIGAVDVEGLTLEQAANAIAAEYERARILRQPRVTVSLVAARPLRIGIAGEVNRPGSYRMGQETTQFPTLTTALREAGGVTQAADLQQIQVRRPRRGRPEQIISINLSQLLETGDLSYDLTLRDGDTIFVPTAVAINPHRVSQLASASFAVEQEQPINIAVSGEVKRPGPYSLPTGDRGIPTVTQAIQAAGGIRLLANIEQIQVRRLTQAGFEQTIELDLMPLLSGADLQQDLILQDGDSIFIPAVENIDLARTAQLRTASFSTEDAEPLNIAVIGEVFRPGPYTVSGAARTGQAGQIGRAEGGVGNVAPTVTRALQVAGGVKPMADIHNIEIRRVTRSGETESFEVDLWELLQSGDVNQDTVLQEGDTVVVPVASEISSAEMAQIAQASFSPDSIRVNVVGEVENAGVVQIPPNTPLNQAILSTGGFTDRASQDTVELIRFDADGRVERRKITLDFAQDVNSASNPALQNNDVIIVSRSVLANIGDTVQTIITPLNQIRSLFFFPASFVDFFRSF